jgi:hypothetical protein
MARCQPVKLRPLGASRATFALRCGRHDYPGWQAVRQGGRVGIVPPSSGPRLSRASLDALRVPVFVSWSMANVGKWPD